MKNKFKRVKGWNKLEKNYMKIENRYNIQWNCGSHLISMRRTSRILTCTFYQIGDIRERILKVNWIKEGEKMNGPVSRCLKSLVYNIELA